MAAGENIEAELRGVFSICRREMLDVIYVVGFEVICQRVHALTPLREHSLNLRAWETVHQKQSGS